MTVYHYIRAYLYLLLYSSIVAYRKLLKCYVKSNLICQLIFPQISNVLMFAQIRDETDTRIDLPNETSESDAIMITGKRENVEKAKARIEAIQKELVRWLVVDIFR